MPKVNSADPSSDTVDSVPTANGDRPSLSR